ncbi:hypothetical protein AUJ14_00150 [Candidatus Micrarchaeota archaeon CG1_02_55_22]|nr:MAG: hypothetical protein AUJ14_00150 [Candidatus Micrarchaeota archaeon CG1_02_55_22]
MKPSTTIALSAQSVFKSYGGNEALHGVSFDVRKGEIFSLLGKNGAGKTTFIRIATGQLLPTSGTVIVSGHDVVSNADSVRELISLVPQDARVIKSSSALEFVQLYLALCGHSLADSRRRAFEGLNAVGIGSFAGVACNRLSGGNRHKLLLACAISSNAPILFLDEPTVGLDAQSRRELWKTLAGLRRKGRTIVLTTHYMDEAEVLSDRVAVIHNGVVAAIGSPQQIIAGTGFELRLDVDASAAAGLRAPKGVERFEFGQKIRFVGAVREVEALAKRAVSMHLPISVARANLEDAFVKLTGETAATGEKPTGTASEKGAGDGRGGNGRG